MKSAPMNFDSRMLAIFDPARLQHRVKDAVDWWWYDLDQQFVEMNAGNVLFGQLPDCVQCLDRRDKHVDLPTPLVFKEDMLIPSV